MEFITEKTDYSVAEFYEEFHNNLPKIVMVNQGFCGEIVEDTFDREQIIRLHAISRQRRVIAKFQYANQSRLLSIPATYDEKLCIVKHGKHGKEKQIYNLLKENTLPLTVQFPKDRVIAVGNQSVSTNNIPHMELIQTFDEVYLLGNFITDGVMSQEVVHVPLYLSQLRLSVVTGIKGQPKEKWTGYQQELERTSSYIEYDQEFGNTNIAEYDPSAIHSDMTYSYVEPRAYANIITLVQKSPCRSFDNQTYSAEQHHEDGPGVYEEIDNTARDVLSSPSKHTQPPKQPAFKKELETALKTERKASDATQIGHDMTTQPKLSKPQTQHAGAPPPLAPKPNVKHITPEPDYNAGADTIPDIPERRAIPGIPKTTLHSDVTANATYSNDVPRSRISPTMHQQSRSLTEHSAQFVPCPPLPQHGEGEKTVRDIKGSEDVVQLSIEEVSDYLKKLKLDKYADSFKEQMIDGTMLVELDKDMLKEDFGMKGIEALRLMKFAKDGHVPT